MKILVTGGAGFIGSHIVDEYITNNHEVIVIDNLSTGKLEHIHPEAKFYECDITNIEELNRIFNEEQPDIVNHHAAQIDIRKATLNPIEDANINIIGSLNVIKSCVSTNVKRVIFASSGGAIYDEIAELPHKEDAPINPISAYGIAKYTIEQYLNFYNRAFNLDSVILRYSNVYGPRQNSLSEAGVITIFINKLLKNEIPIIYGDGSHTRDFVYVNDVVRANVLALESFVKHDAYNVGTGIQTSILDLYNLISNMLNVDIEKTHGFAKGEEIVHNSIDNNKLNQFDWKIETDLKDGLNITINHFKSKLTI